MPNILLWGTILVFAINSFGYTYCLSGVNRAFYGCFKAIAESSVIAYSDTGTAIDPYFSKSLFTNKCEEYFASALRGYTKTYELDFYFCDSVTKEVVERPTQAEVGITCKVYSMSTYHRSAAFFIKEGKHGGK